MTYDQKANIRSARAWRAGYGDGWDHARLGYHLQPDDLEKEDEQYQQGYMDAMKDYEIL